MTKRENVLMFVKPYSFNDGENGNPIAMDILKYLYEQGCSFNRGMAVRVTPKMLITHYDELMREGRANIVYRMIGDYVSENISEKLLKGETLTEGELNVPGKVILAFDMSVPYDMTIEETRDKIIGPTKIMDLNGWVNKLGKDKEKYANNAKQLLIDAEEKVENQYKTVRGIYQNLGEGAIDSFNTVHCSANTNDRDIELNNFFGKEEFNKYATMLDVNKITSKLDDMLNDEAISGLSMSKDWVEINDMINMGYSNPLNIEEYKLEESVSTDED